MSGNSFGKNFRVTTFGESHGAGVGCVIEGVPAGLVFNADFIQEILNRRRPNANNPANTPRIEPDQFEVLSGVFNGKTEGTPIALLIRNTNQNSAAYDELKDVFRPGHADFSYECKYGKFRDYRGGGRSSGRETAGRVAAGALAQNLLLQKGVKITAYTIRAAGVGVSEKNLAVVEQNAMRAPDLAAASKMLEQIEKLRAEGNSCGGVVECVIDGVQPGVGEPVFDKLDARLAQAMLSIGAIKGIEFGDGFACVDSTGLQNNDQMHVDPATNLPVFDSNHCGGILGGLSNGNQIVFRVAVKPVPSIRLNQKTVKKSAGKENSFEDCDLVIQGRHDVCLCPRIVPVVEAMAALVLMDFYNEEK